MKRQGFLLGLFSVGGQVLLLRELVSSLNGDELFIGTALFGWLIAVALGAYWGGSTIRPKNPIALFVLGIILLPVMIVAARLSPLAVTAVTGEMVPFSKAVAISILAMGPLGIISGWLFPLITRKVIYPSTDAVTLVYLYEGIGAFVGGLFIFLLIVTNHATLVTALAVSFVVAAGLLTTGNIVKKSAVAVGLIVCLALILGFAGRGETMIERIKYRDFEIAANLDTPYGHHLLLMRDNGLTLMTDNTIEAFYPDPETAENSLLPPMIYVPQSKKTLYIGRADLLTASLDPGISTDTVTAVDPREVLDRAISNLVKERSPLAVRWRHTDPVDYFMSRPDFGFYDIVILNSGLPDNYHNSRYLTPRFLRSVRSTMADSSVLAIPLAYDTDRYLTPEIETMLSIIRSTLASVFVNVSVWPGTTTIFLASDKVPLDLTVDEIIARFDEYKLSGEYISDAYLYDRLSAMKVERLRTAISGGETINTVEKPILTHYQALYRATADPADRKILSFLLEKTSWLLVLPAAIIWFFIASFRRQNRNRTGAYFLYFTAGVVSLSLELISFYLYQTMAGSLYSEMALLIGSFMLGLAVGTYYAHKVGDGPLQFPALIILLVATLIFLTTWNRVGTDALLPFHLFFLFVVAVATGTLFVAATNLYYGDEKRANRGIGYACEIAGSALGAFFTLTILLPAIGLTWLLISLAALLAAALAGSLAFNNPLRPY